nr:hypothetical protein [uncultured Friedmanniella sp.]
MAAGDELWVDAGPFRAHLRHLVDVGGFTATEIAVLAGVPPRMAISLLLGRAGRPVRRISAANARALLQLGATDVRALRTRQVPAEESRTRLRRLLRGQRLPDLAEELGVAVSSLQELVDGGSAWCSARLALKLLTTSRTRPGAAEAPAPLVGVAA